MLAVLDEPGKRTLDRISLWPWRIGAPVSPMALLPGGAVTRMATLARL